MKAFKVISDPDAFQLLADETRRRIVHLLRGKEHTVSQLAEELGLTPQAIYHHIRKMKEAGLVEVAREERVEHFIETYYRASAEVFHLAHGSGSGTKVLEEETREALGKLPDLGIKVHLDDETVSRIVDLIKTMKAPEEKSPWNEKVADLQGVGFLAKQTLLEYANLLSMNDKEFDTFLDRYRELRRTLKSLVEQPMVLEKKA